ncbi:CZB domain-containing protein [Stenoxybacter acetivorans]|uniref:CZB domain-containing protein n=1 Tax=Stenoxybacter acetivorans TaxID=422441 RepID=UPI00068A77E9|nr:CZB domain-containing protein [Stenoxybacter acetivorans]
MSKNIDTAAIIAGHEAWIQELKEPKSSKRQENPERYKPEKASADNLCPLGVFLYGEGKQYEASPEYAALLKAHAEFHLCVGKILSYQEVARFLDATEALREEMPILSQRVKENVLAFAAA